MRIVAMFRVSTERQADEGASLDAQERIYREMAARNGWTTVAEYRGCESASQAASDRRVLQQVLACIREQAPDGLYVHEQSRLTRGDELDVALLMRELRERGAKVIVGGVVRDLGSLDERFMMSIQSAVDRNESERFKERSARGRRERALQGKMNVGDAPYGYENPPKGDRGRGTLRIVADSAATVRKIFEMTAAGASTRVVAESLNGLGMPAPRAPRWGASSVKKILLNIAYCGTHVSGAWVETPKGSGKYRFDPTNPKAVIIPNAYPRIIDEELWAAAHSRPKPPCTPVPRALTGLLWVDDKKYESDSAPQRAYYRPPRGVHGHAWLDSPETDDAVWAAFSRLATGPEFVERLMAETANPKQQQIVEQDIAHLRGQIAKLGRRLDRLVTMRADGELGRETYLARAAETNGEIKRMETELAALRAKAMAFDGATSARVVKAVQVLIGGQTKLTAKQKGNILRSIVKRIDVEAVRNDPRQNRGAGGRVLQGQRRWSVGKVTFTLAIPSDAALAPTAPDGDQPERIAQDLRARDSRIGQLATTESSSATPNPRHAPPPRTGRHQSRTTRNSARAPTWSGSVAVSRPTSQDPN